MKVKVFIHAKYDEYDKEFGFHAWGYDMTGQNVGPLVETRELEFTPPPHDVLVNGTIAKYREQQKTIRAEAEGKINEIQQRINDLLCIEYKPDEPNVTFGQSISTGPGDLDVCGRELKPGG